MRIGIDIDGVLTNIERYALDNISKYCVENNLKYKIDVANYNYDEMFDISEEEENAFWEKSLESYARNEKVRPFAAEVINKLKEDGHEIYIVTARWLSNRDDELGKQMREIVRKWLSENEIIYDKLVFSKGANENKQQEMIDYKINIMIEDSPNNINTLSNIIPIICFDAGYNKECVGDNIYRCYSWYDIYNLITNL